MIRNIPRSVQGRGRDGRFLLWFEDGDAKAFARHWL